MTITPEIGLSDAAHGAAPARLMLEHRYGGVPVLADGRLIGIITQGDLLKALIDLLRGERAPLERPELEALRCETSVTHRTCRRDGPGDPSCDG